MKEAFISSLFRPDKTVPVSGLHRIPSGANRDFRKVSSGTAPKLAPKPAATHSYNIGGREEYSDEQTAHTRAKSQGGHVTDPSGRVTKYPKPTSEAKNVAPAVQVSGGGEDSVKDKEHGDDKGTGGPAMDWAQKTAAELREAWWCGTPALEAASRGERLHQAKKHKGKVERSQFPDVPKSKYQFKGKPERAKAPDSLGDWSLNAMDKPVTEAEKPKVKPAKPASKPKASKPAEKTGDETHKGLLLKMAKAVTNSTAKGISAKHILAAGYAMHTFDDETLATPRPKKATKTESISTSDLEGIIEDTLSGDVGTIALGFAPVGQLDPRRNPDILRPGGKKKKKRTNQYRKLAQMVASTSGV